jgi:hypothetical protein
MQQQEAALAAGSGGGGWQGAWTGTAGRSCCSQAWLEQRGDRSKSSREDRMHVDGGLVVAAPVVGVFLLVPVGCFLCTGISKDLQPCASVVDSCLQVTVTAVCQLHQQLVTHVVHVWYISYVDYHVLACTCQFQGSLLWVAQVVWIDDCFAVCPGRRWCPELRCEQMYVSEGMTPPKAPTAHGMTIADWGGSCSCLHRSCSRV